MTDMSWGSFSDLLTADVVVHGGSAVVGDYGHPPYPEPLPYWLLADQSALPVWGTDGATPCLVANGGAAFALVAQAQVLKDGARVAGAFGNPSSHWTASVGFACEGAGGGRFPYTGGLWVTLDSPASGACTVSITGASDGTISALTAGVVFLTTRLTATRRALEVGVWSTPPPITGGTPDLYARTVDCSAYDPDHPLLGPCYPRLGGALAVKAYEWCADTSPLVDSSGDPPIRRPELIYRLSKYGSRLRRLEVVGVGAVKRSVFLYYAADGSLPITWGDDQHDLQIGEALLDGAGTLTYTLNGSETSLPVSLSRGDRLVVTVADTGDDGVGVTLVESLNLS